MKITDSKLLHIAINATFFSESLDNPAYKHINLEKLDQNLIQKRIDNWCKALGGAEKLKKFLYSYGLDLNTIRPFLATADSVEHYTLPSWADTLNELIQTSTASCLDLKSEERSPLNPEKPLPFEDFYFPFILFARHQLHDRLSPNHPLELLSKEAYEALERILLKQLSDLGVETLLFEFDKFRENRASQDRSNSQENTDKTLYRIFIQNLLEDEDLTFFQQYPVLARLIAMAVNFWVKSTAEFIERLQADLLAIELTFSSNRSLGKVKDIDTSRSNPHNNRRFVLALTFSSGVKVVYKPKDLGLDIAFNQLLDWCNQQKTSLSLKFTKILNRQGYGWVEFISHQPCQDRTEVQRFYQRVGMLLSFFYLLGASDCTSENLIANQEYPILIDADILMSPVRKSLDESEEWLENSVFNTGLLPSWKGNLYSANAQDFSFLGNIYPKQINCSKEWRSIGTDRMHLVSKSVVIPPGANVVILDGKTVSPNNYLEEILTGFTDVYRLLIKEKKNLLNQESPLLSLKFLKSRFILRPTIIYGLISKQSLSPEYLRDGKDYSIAIENSLDSHNCSHLKVEENPEFWTIWQTEIKSLQQQDIPFFSGCCDLDDLEVEPNRAIKHFFQTSSYQRLIAKLQSLDERDLALQIRWIRLSFYTKFAHLTQKNWELEHDCARFSLLTPEEALQEALNIGNSLVANKIQNTDGCNWISLEYMYRANRYQLKPLDNSLYTGRAGVSLFLAALAKLTGKSEFKDIALATLSSLRPSLERPEVCKELLQSELGLLGLGGIIYSLVKISQFLQESIILEDAQQAARLIKPEIIAADRKLDIMWGVAGLIPGLLHLYDRTSDLSILNIAVACGEHLLSKRTHNAPKAWLTLENESKRPLTGFSHGASGISLSLLRLYAATENTIYLEAAMEGLEYERTVFDKLARNWPDFRLSEQTAQINFLNVWCHGSVGIGLARLGSLSVIQTEETYSDIEIALETNQKYGISSREVDHLCCGSLGRTELFVVASQKLGEREWLNTARKQAAWIVEKARQNKAYAFLPHLPYSVLSPSFFRGSSGVGYQLLRLASPECLPSVLILD
jgi:type 2 lantibiotic biosynthesis protein LanM